MKTKFTFAIALLLVNLASIAQTSSNCPIFFRRNNGNGSCPDGQLKLYFTTCPEFAPIIDSVYTNGVKQVVRFSAPDISKCANLGYLTYCVAGGNMPPSSNWQIFFHSTNISNVFGCLVPEGGEVSLPVKYFSFDALVADKTIVLNWITDLEVNNNHFELQRSENGTDFSTIGLILDGFENGTKKSYQFKDYTLDMTAKKVVYYRLKQIDNNGSFTYSDVLVVKLQVKAGMVIQAVPNPFTETLNISFSASEAGVAQIKVINITGQSVFTKQTTLSKGYNTVQLNNIEKITPGIYVAQLIINGAVAGFQKIIKN